MKSLYLWSLPFLALIIKAEQVCEPKKRPSALELRLARDKALNEDLKITLDSIIKSCGEVCDTTIKGKPDKYFDQVTKNFDCPALFSNPDIDLPLQVERPPRKIPAWALDHFTYQGRIDLDDDFRDDSKPDTNPNVYDFSKLRYENINILLDRDRFASGYGKEESMKVNKFIKDHLDVKGKQVLVIGSESPWIEIMALRNGAKHVYTLEYSKINNEIEDITTLLPSEFNKMYLEGKLPEFDAVISYSSIEHSGLGRYGDNLNPWGDLIVMARAWCTMKPGGRALIGVPIGPGKDLLIFNTGRDYGPIMLSQVFANFKQIYSEFDYAKFHPLCQWCYQDLFVLEK